MYRDVGVDHPGVQPRLIQWSAVFGGTIIGAALLILLAALWVAAGFQGGVDTIASNIEWYLAGSAIFALFVGGFLAGWMAGVRGLLSGLMNGMTVWGLVTVLGLIFLVPGAIGLLQVSPAEATVDGFQGRGLWAAFWSILIALGAAALGGLLGGLTPRAGAVAAEYREHYGPAYRDADLTERQVVEERPDYSRMEVPPHEHRGGEIYTEEHPDRRRTA